MSASSSVRVSASLARTHRAAVGGQGSCLLRGLLRLASIPYGVASSCIEYYQTAKGGLRVGVPVISVGNLTTGGTGKTPFVSMVVADLLETGHRPVILSRGYAAEADGANDEARVLLRKHPGVLHLQDKDRASLAKRVDDGRLGDVIVLDDGFQHHALHRDLDVCCVDATNPFGYDALLPAGTLRESPSSLYRARPVVITRSELVSESELAALKTRILEHNEHARIVVTRMRFTSLVTVSDGELKPGGEPSSLQGENVVVASGIGNPGAFRTGVARLGARVLDTVEQGDHHAWSEDDVAELVARARKVGATRVVTTLKDAVKLARLPWPESATPLEALDVEVEIVEGADLWKSLLQEALSR